MNDRKTTWRLDGAGGPVLCARTIGRETTALTRVLLAILGIARAQLARSTAIADAIPTTRIIGAVDPNALVRQVFRVINVPPQL